jgi:hypothetical protein
MLFACKQVKSKKAKGKREKGRIQNTGDKIFDQKRR